MAYQRAQWHSGLTYRQICDTCKAVVEYTDEILDFRPWYADGYVDCPRCKSHLRHNENYAINSPVAPKVVEAEVTAAPDSTGGTAKFCTACGAQFRDADRFCASCGAKRA